ncbi:MAG TPA: ATP-grasp domain-containing protein [Solirubrobacteraceae bacterium]|nr:ATP-grasp domain-containing protein [Solirubrobacteraceae bacterium]
MAQRRVSAGGRTLLVVSGGTEAVAGILRARELGLHVVVSDGSEVAPGLAVADDAILASTYDVEATVAAARDYHERTRAIDGVICIASDVPLTVASVAAELGIPGIPVASALLATDKLAMKERFAADGIRVPWFAAVDSREELDSLLGQRGLPAVLKPVDSRGARGVLLLTEEIDAGWAYATSRAQSPSGRLLLEQYLPGPQISTESLVIGGRAHTIGLADRNYRQLARFAPFVIEDGGELPSALADDELAGVLELVQRATESLGVRDGVVKGDVVLSGGEPFVIELAPRLSGGYLCTYEIPLSTGVDFVGIAIRIALGEEIPPAELIPAASRGVAQRWLFPSPGRVQRVAGVEEVAHRPEVALCEVRVAEGDEIGPVDSHPARAGVIIATGATREQAIEAAEKAVSDIAVETAPV